MPFTGFIELYVVVAVVVVAIVVAIVVVIAFAVNEIGRRRCDPK